MKLVEKVARKQQEMLPSRPRPALAKWEPWSQGVWDRWPSPGEETQVTPRKHALPRPHLLTQTLHIGNALSLKDQRSLQVINFTCRTD